MEINNYFVHYHKMILNVLLVIILIILLCFYYVIWYWVKSKLHTKQIDTSEVVPTTYPDLPVVTKDNTIPYTIVLTTDNISKVPIYIWNQYKQLAKEYTLLVFDDTKCEQFLRKFYGEIAVDKFNSMKWGAHKADLFRYAYLYLFGGCYFDIKTLLQMPIKEIVKHDKPNICYMVYTPTSKNIYNGIICTSPNNSYIGDMFNYIIYTDITNYMQICKYSATLLSTYLNKKSLSTREYKMTNNFVLDLWHEIFVNAYKYCNNKKDRYNLCSVCTNSRNQILFRVRDPTYPW